jgi:hypothetical protein
MRTTMNTTLRATALLALLSLVACGEDAVDGGPIGIDEDTSTIDDTVDNDVVDNDSPESDAVVDVVEDTADADTSIDVEDDVEGDTIDADVEIRCTSDEQCDDGITCTNDRCDTEAGLCTWAVAPQQCLVRGQCFRNGTVDPADPCMACAPGTSALAFTPREEGASCNDADACTVGELCTAGECVGESLTCNDGNDCTADLCDVELGCVAEPISDGISCDDASLCTDDDVCFAGECVGDTVTCDDDDPCTDDTCAAETGCAAIEHSRSCNDFDACTVADACTDGECGGRAANCDDGNACTIDLCDEYAGCQHLPTLNPCCQGSVSICDDGDPCTTDLCDPATAGCAYEANTASCDDGNACTEFDTCSDGLCDGEALDCGDGNDCTDDFCRPSTGCEYSDRNSGACEDGIDCTLNDACVEGECVAGVSECVCEPTFGLDAIKLTSVAIGPDGLTGSGLDIDGNPGTCSPRANCENGIDNTLYVAASFANDALASSMADGSLILTIDLDNIAFNPFTASVFTADLAPSNPECDTQVATCDYLIGASTLDPATCAPLISLPATRVGNRIFAGGADTIFTLEVPLGGGVLALTLFKVQLQGNVVLDAGRVVSFDGILGGAVRKVDLLAAIDALPADALPPPLTPSAVRNLINTAVTNDIDTDGDGILDAASIGLPVAGIRGNLVGVAP